MKYVSMKKFFQILYSFLNVLFFQCYSFNIDTDNPIIYLDQTKFLSVPPSSKSSFFGLSVLLYAGNNVDLPWIQIGAPRGNSPRVSFKNPGVVFRCPIGERCIPLEVDTEIGRKELNGEIYENKLDDAWMGATMDINVKFNRTVVCAPRWINSYHDDGRPGQYRMIGACYWSHLNSQVFSTKLLPLLDSLREVGIDPVSHQAVYLYMQGESGFSVHMPQSKREMLIGAPGVLDWRGTYILFKDRTSTTRNPIASRYTYAENAEEHIYDTKTFRDATVVKASTEITPSGLSGYALTSGYFYSNSTLHYVSGAPRSNNLFGQVIIYDFPKNQIIKNSKQGGQYGEYFGAALAAGDINNDGYDDLFVGAPFHKTVEHNEGRVYLFLGSPEGHLVEPPHTKFVDGTERGGQFGTTVIYLGDMNRNGAGIHKPKYVAVSAPYEASSGVVYIFRGDFYDLNTVPVQRIVGSSFHPTLKGFGISISKPADVDGNGYDDIAIGAYQSGHVVLLRGKALVRLTTKFERTPKTIRSDERSFDIELCHWYTVFKGMTSVQISRRIVVDANFGRAFLKYGNQEEAQLTLNERRRTCENVTINLHENLTNLFDPLTIKVTHNLIEEEGTTGRLIIGEKATGSDHFCTRCGVYDDSDISTQTVTGTVLFDLGCGEDNICLEELEFEPQFMGAGVRNKSFILGSSNIVDLETVIINRGEKAYYLRVQVDLPTGLNFKKTPRRCDQNGTRIICQVANPLNKGERRSISIPIDMDYINKGRSVGDSFFINVTLLSSGQNSRKNFKLVALNLKTEASVAISGKSGDQSYSYEPEGKQIEFQQIYQVDKTGLSPVSLIQIQIMVPYAIKTDSGTNTFLSLHQPEGYLDGQKLILSSDIPYIEEMKFVPPDGAVPGQAVEIRNKRDVEMSEVELLNETMDMTYSSEQLKNDAFDSDLLGNGTFEINCNMTEVICGRIYGKLGPFDASKKSAVLGLKMIFDAKALNGILKKDSIVRYSTYGFVQIEDVSKTPHSGRRSDMIAVSSIFVTGRGKIEAWIFIVAIILGFLLLILLTYGLLKAGFFKRMKREELEKLKAEAGVENPVNDSTLGETDTGDENYKDAQDPLGN